MYGSEIKIAIAICILQFIYLIFHLAVGQLVNIRATFVAPSRRMINLWMRGMTILERHRGIHG